MSSKPPHAEAGFATADALVAMLILAVTIALSVQTVATGRKLSRKATEVRQAQLLLDQLLTQPSPAEATEAGATPAFEWRLESRIVSPLVDPEAPRFCERQATLQSLPRRAVYTGALKTLCAEPVAGAS